MIILIDLTKLYFKALIEWKKIGNYKVSHQKTLWSLERKQNGGACLLLQTPFQVMPRDIRMSYSIILPLLRYI